MACQWAGHVAYTVTRGSLSSKPLAGLAPAVLSSATPFSVWLSSHLCFLLPWVTLVSSFPPALTAKDVRAPAEWSTEPAFIHLPEELRLLGSSTAFGPPTGCMFLLCLSPSGPPACEGIWQRALAAHVPFLRYSPGPSGQSHASWRSPPWVNIEVPEGHRLKCQEGRVGDAKAARVSVALWEGLI